MAAESSGSGGGGRGGLKTTKTAAKTSAKTHHHKSNSSSHSTGSGTAVAITMKKKSSTTTAGTKKEEEQHIKLVLRRLPPGLTKEELWEQMQPLPNEPLAFWFCPAPKNNTDLHQIPRAAHFARAYFAFREEKDAVALAERFNGYVFVDKQGNESMAIVECAPSQHLPKDLNRPAKECDARTGTLENEMQYQQFLEEYEQKMAQGPRRVIDFDALVRELEEKERRMQSGQVQETPLTEYISKMGMEKGRKKQQKLIDRLERRLQQQHSPHQIVTTDWAEVYRKEGIEIVGSSEGGGSTRKKEEKKDQKSAANLTKKQKMTTRMEKFTQWQERRNEQGQGQCSNSANPVTADAKQTTKKESKKSTTTAVKNVGKSGDQSVGERKEMPQKVERSLSENVDNNSESKSSPKPVKKSTTGTTGRRQNDENGAAANQNSDAAKSTKKSSTAAAGRNRDRPEREIYRPGKARLQSRKSAESTLTTANSRDDPFGGDASNSKPSQQQK